MKFKIFCIIICILFIGIIIFPAAAELIINTEQCRIKNSCQTLSGIYFYQVDYLWNQGVYTDSNTGLIEVNIDEINSATGLSAGYVNVYTEEGWVIHNLAIVEGFVYPTVGIYFDLGRTDDIKSIEAYVGYTVNPLTTFEYSGAMSPYSIGDRILNAEGGEDVIRTTRPQPPDPDTLPGNTGEYDPVGLNTYCAQKKHPNVQAAYCQCVPAAYANNLQYLENWYGINIPHDHIPGLKGNPSNSLVGELDVYMERPCVSREDGNPTIYNKSILGLVKYAYFNSLPIDIRHQGWKGNQDVTYLDYTSYGQGSTIKFDFIYQEICQGSAVELGMGSYYPTGKRDGGHMVQIVSAGYIYGVPYVYCLDDSDQISPGVPHGDTIGTEGPPIKCDLVDSDLDGMYNLVGWPIQISFPPNVECIYVQQAKNSPPLKPSIPVGGELIMKKNVEYEFSTSTTDPNDDSIWYFFDWGDGFASGWLGPFESGDTCSAKHIWYQDGVYEIKVKAKDFDDAESEWSEPRVGVVPKSFFISKNPLIFQILKHTPI